MADNNQPVPQVPAPTPAVTQIGATTNPATQQLQKAQPLAQTSNTGYSTAGSAMRKPGENEASFQERAIAQKNTAQAAGGGKPGDMIYDPSLDPNAKIKKFDPATSYSYTVGGKDSGIFKKPEVKSYESGSSLTNTIPNIMADNNVQSAIGSVTQPVSTGIMRSVPQLGANKSAAPQIDLLSQFKSGLDTI